jgi:YYY domain-containing protein
MAMPIALLVLAAVTSLVMADGGTPLRAEPLDTRSGGAGRRAWLAVAAAARVDGPALLLFALAVGALWPTNAWDFPTYLALSAVGLVLAQARRSGRWRAGVFGASLARLAAVAIAARLLYLPFSRNFATAYNRPVFWEGSRTLFVDFLTVHGVFLFFIASYLAARLGLRRAFRDAARRLGAEWRWQGRRAALRRRITLLDVRRRATGAAVLGAVALGVALAAIRLTVEGLLAAILVLALVELFACSHHAAAARLLAAMVALAAGLALTVEHLVLAGDIGRMNTVFKSYLQIWTLWGVAAAVAASVVWRRRPRSRLWVGAAAALVAAALLYPALATPARLRDRFDANAAKGLDGESYFALAVYHEAQGQIELRLDHEAIDWLRRTVEGSPVVLEASVPPYRWGSRVSVYTGLPTVIGWDWHQRQQRSVLRDESVPRRVADVSLIYSTDDLDEALELLRRYAVEYVYVGPVERLYYPARGLYKFEARSDRGLEEVFRNDAVRIYRVGADPRISAR